MYVCICISNVKDSEKLIEKYQNVGSFNKNNYDFLKGFNLITTSTILLLP